MVSRCPVVANMSRDARLGSDLFPRSNPFHRRDAGLIDGADRHCANRVGSSCPSHAAPARQGNDAMTEAIPRAVFLR